MFHTKSNPIKLPKVVVITSVVAIVAAMIIYSTYFLLFNKKPSIDRYGSFPREDSCPQKDYSTSRKVKFNWGEVDYIAKNEGNLLGIYKFPEFDLYAYQEKKLFSGFPKNILSLSANALSCYPVDSLEGGDYVLVNNNPKKKVDYSLQSLASAKNFYVGGDYNRATDGYMENFINNLNIFQQKNVLSGRSDAQIILLDKKIGEFIQTPNFERAGTANRFTEEDVDWSKLNSEQKTLIEKTKNEMQDNFEFKYRELIESGCVYTSYDCNVGLGVPTKDSKNTISEKDKEVRLLTAEVGYPGSQQLQNPSAQRILNLSDPKNLEIKFNLVFNYQQKTGEFWDS